MSRIEWAGKTEAGTVRETNEDAFSVYALTAEGAELQPDAGTRPDLAAGGMVLTVADGVGGQNAGEVASALVVSGLPEELAGLAGTAAPLPSRDCGGRLETALRRTNGRVRQESASAPDRAGMAATASVLWLLGERGFLGHVGDSRVYRYRDGELRHVSHVQSAVGRAVRSGELSEAEGKVAARRNVLDQAMGVREEQLEPEIDWLELMPGDLFLLCSDGLVDRLRDQDLAESIGSADGQGVSLSEIARQLVDRALKSGSRDNVTVLLARLGPEDAPTGIRNGRRGRQWMAFALGLILGGVLGLGGVALWKRDQTAGPPPADTSADIVAVQRQLKDLRARLVHSESAATAAAARLEELDQLLVELRDTRGSSEADGAGGLASGAADERWERAVQLLEEIRAELEKAAP